MSLLLQVNDIGFTVLCTHLTADLIPVGLDYCTFHPVYVAAICMYI